MNKFASLTKIPSNNVNTIIKTTLDYYKDNGNGNDTNKEKSKPKRVFKKIKVKKQNK